MAVHLPIGRFVSQATAMGTAIVGMNRLELWVQIARLTDGTAN